MSFERRERKFLQAPGARGAQGAQSAYSRQFRPASSVLKVRPSVVVTVAVRASDAETATRSTDAGKGSRVKFVPSVDSSTRPLLPTIQATRRPGEAPASTSSFGRDAHGKPVRPPSSDRSMVPGAVARHRLLGSGDTIFGAAICFRNCVTAPTLGAARELRACVPPLAAGAAAAAGAISAARRRGASRRALCPPSRVWRLFASGGGLVLAPNAAASSLPVSARRGELVLRSSLAAARDVAPRVGDAPVAAAWRRRALPGRTRTRRCAFRGRVRACLERCRSGRRCWLHRRLRHHHPDGRRRPPWRQAVRTTISTGVIRPAAVATSLAEAGIVFTTVANNAWHRSHVEACASAAATPAASSPPSIQAATVSASRQLRSVVTTRPQA